MQLQEAKVARPVALLFVGMDIDHNLIVTEDELNKGIDAEFARADQDKSGVITGFEMMDWGKAVLGDSEALPDLREMDTDMNYTVTPPEFATALRHAFQRMDVNGDGALTRAEMLFEIPNMRMGAPGGEVGGGRRRGSGEGRRRGGGGAPGGDGGGSPPF
jgi:Ca2+-binding EF-hand superfamily protein